MPPQLPDSPSGEVAKNFGAYYTDPQVAQFLVRWAVRRAEDSVIDPAFGGGVFLQAASQHLKSLGGKPENQVFGVELDPQVHAQTSQALAQTSVQPPNLIQSDFFDLEPGQLPPIRAVVGNPPFIRYQRFTGGRDKALAKAAAEGVGLSKLASSWAPFLVHSVALLEPGGRLGLVIPAELGHAAYAQPVLHYLARSFEQITLVTFRKKLFPHLSQDTLLLLAEGRKLRPENQKADFYLLDLEDWASLNNLGTDLPSLQPMNAQGFSEGQERLVEYWLPRNVRELYRELRASTQTVRLGQLADVGIGYVTGGNDYFHLSPETAREWNIPSEFLRPTIRRGRALKGLRFTQQDWKAALGSGEVGYLLYIPPSAELPQAVQRYIQHGQDQRVHQAYKCRVRKPWYSVPQVYKPDAFLTYMSGESPRLVANHAGVVAPNTLHILRLKPLLPLPDMLLSPQGERVGVRGLAGLWQSSLTRLSAEIEGHAMGGGMLKLEPSEAERVVLASPKLSQKHLQALADKLDRLIRSDKPYTALELADQAILERLGLDKQDRQSLLEGAVLLKQRRYKETAHSQHESNLSVT